MKIKIPPEERCRECKGAGEVIVSRNIKTFFTTCPACIGTGRNTSDVDELNEKIRRIRKKLGIK